MAPTLRGPLRGWLVNLLLLLTTHFVSYYECSPPTYCFHDMLRWSTPKLLLTCWNKIKQSLKDRTSTISTQMVSFPEQRRFDMFVCDINLFKQCNHVLDDLHTYTYWLWTHSHVFVFAVVYVHGILRLKLSIYRWKQHQFHWTCRMVSSHWSQQPGIISIPSRSFDRSPRLQSWGQIPDASQRGQVEQ